ncbi:phage tail collar domain-containing protein [Clostridium aceticum]|uniref:Phage tail collar domain-containing protein n=1 Tax=Clostridium aceticum TaxID=84022 RepID=A0A0D8IAI3_9CLOT|nr:tail fiber protein [Clostridium aceticum]AKL96035.1 phage tail collar domain-containing protein [Clostridium aceticum]KJF27032.1 phage tail protein [Clostridium aceticum]
MDCFIGQIELFPYNFVPQDWIACEGQLLQINANQALYSLLGARYGGNGSTTFGIPNLRGAEPVPGMIYCMALVGLYPMRS